MWELFTYIIKYTIDSGGVWGLLFALSIFFISFREYKSLKVGKKDEGTQKPAIPSDDILFKERQKNQAKALELQAQKLNEIKDHLVKISAELSSFGSISKENSELIDKLSGQIRQINDERVDELKDILSSYHKTMTELSLTLQHLKLILRSKVGED